MFQVGDNVSYLDLNSEWQEGFRISKVYDNTMETYYQIQKGHPWEYLLTVEEYRLRASNEVLV